MSVVNANAMQIPLSDESVQCVVTSPPYWGLRDYGTASWIGGDEACDHIKSRGGHLADSITSTRGGGNKVNDAQSITFLATCRKCGAHRVDAQLGLEPTIDEYVANMVAVFREVRRVLRDDGVLFLNLGDRYSSGSDNRGKLKDDDARVMGRAPVGELNGNGWAKHRKPTDGLKPKDLCGIPWRVAFALQADGWYLRSDIIWNKPNPMPESVTDRPTKAHEYIFLLTKSPAYYYDAEAIAEPSEYPGDTRHLRHDSRKVLEPLSIDNGRRFRTGKPTSITRNRRSVWTIPTQSYAEAHFATFPEQLPRLCILAGTSERGCCPKCRAPWERVTEKTAMVIDRSSRTHELGRTCTSGTMLEPAHSKTTGWKPTCDCNAGDPVPCIVFDPFSGSGTTGKVAISLGREYVGTELSREYIALSEDRMTTTIGMALA